MIYEFQSVVFSEPPPINVYSTIKYRLANTIDIPENYILIAENILTYPSGLFESPVGVELPQDSYVFWVYNSCSSIKQLISNIECLFDFTVNRNRLCSFDFTVSRNSECAFNFSVTEPLICPVIIDITGSISII